MLIFRYTLVFWVSTGTCLQALMYKNHNFPHTACLNTPVITLCLNYGLDPCLLPVSWCQSHTAKHPNEEYKRTDLECLCLKQSLVYLWHHKFTEILTACLQAQFLNTNCEQCSVNWAFWYFHSIYKAPIPALILKRHGNLTLHNMGPLTNVCYCCTLLWSWREVQHAIERSWPWGLLERKGFLVKVHHFLWIFPENSAPVLYTEVSPEAVTGNKESRESLSF